MSQADQLTVLSRGGLLAASPLGSGRFSADMVSIGLGDVMLSIGIGTPVAVLGTLDPHTAWLLLPLGEPARIFINGVAAEAHDIGVCGAGAEYELASHGQGGWAIVMLPAGAVDLLVFPPRGSPLLRPGAAAVLRTDPTVHAAAISLVCDAFETFGQDAGVFVVDAARHALRSALLDAAHELLNGVRGGRAGLPRRGAVANRQTVRAADRQLATDPAGPSDTAGLAAVLGITPSRLQAAFAAVLGVDPDCYARRRRLGLAGAAARAGPPRWMSVTHIAEAHGFRDADSFAHAYREMFGEDAATSFPRAGAGA